MAEPGRKVGFVDELRSTWRRAEEEVQQEIEEEEVQTAMREMEDRIEVWRAIEMVFNRK